MTALIERNDFRLLDDPEPIAVDSSLVSAIRYDERAQTLEIRFESGNVYHYLNVPEKVKDTLLTAPSKGAYFNDQIRNRYTFRRIR